MSTHGDMTTYAVLAKRWKRGWELHIDGLGVTQSKTLNDAEAIARDFIMLDTGADLGSFSVEIIPEVGGVLDEETRAARQAVRSADVAQRAAAGMSRDIARKLKKAGLSGREIAVVLEVSPQRVSQLLNSEESRELTISDLAITSKAMLAIMRECTEALARMLEGPRLWSQLRIRCITAADAAHFTASGSRAR
jgi:predicted transcriptional regulator